MVVRGVSRWCGALHGGVGRCMVMRGVVWRCGASRAL